MEDLIHVRNSERGTLDRCPQQWWWAWREGLRPKETAKPLWFGTGIHLALAHYYGPGSKRRKDFIDVWRAFADEEAEYIRVEIGGLDEQAWVDARELGEAMLLGYVKHYGNDRDWDVISTEQSFSVRIPYLNGEGHFILNGTFDGVYRDRRTKVIKLMEHKTAASISTGWLPMDNQGGTYWMVAQTVGREQGWLGPKENIREITYNFLRKAMPDERPKDAQGYSTNKPLKAHYIAALEQANIEWAPGPKGSPVPLDKATVNGLQVAASNLDVPVFGDRSKVQPPPLFERHPQKRTSRERKSQLRRLQAEADKMLMYRDGRLVITKSPSRNTCPMCAFKEMCELHERGSDWEEFRDALYRVDDPYADHRKSA